MAYDPKLKNAMNKYFSLKENYENKQRDSKKNIFNDEGLSQSDKEDALATFKPKCINCRRPVGTTFSETAREFKAVCGDPIKPCALNIEFKLGKTEHIDDIIQSATDTVNELKEKIIHLKAELIYGYKDESEIALEFKDIKSEYNSFQNILESIIRRKTKIIKKDANADKALNQVLNETIQRINNNVKEYLIDKDPIHITNNVKIYNDEIKLLLSDMMKLKYKNTYIVSEPPPPDKNPNIFYLIQETTRLNDLYVSLFKDDISKLINYAT